MAKISLKENVYNSLVKDIISGIYAPNAILTENEMMLKFECSKAPIREALIELCKDNYLKSIPRLGYIVVSYTLKEIVDILDFRIDLETSNLKRLLPSVTDKQLEDFKSSYENFKKNKINQGSVAENWFNNQHFHLELCKLSGNEYVYNVLKHLLRQNSGFFAQYYSYAWHNDTESRGYFHELILEALFERDLEKTCTLLTTDINSVKIQIQKALQ
ncbi:GntR family transcriptional regulator [uncultured Sphaerochaeta sp.]|uniref:GntR family transcriptional regulator n=1 Tax=uncultured Sphaerochaeta sp. TaxID=886478 RepID=UPI002A0A7823|nr:GntR family transcriptional regulator [uncultured Sphaerochaeta sp.]